MNDHVRDLLTIGEACLDVFYDPHSHRAAESWDGLRGPRLVTTETGLLERAARDLNVDLARSWLVSTVREDIVAGRQAGCRTVLLDDGTGTVDIRDNPGRRPHYLAASLPDAAKLIVAASLLAPGLSTYHGLGRGTNAA